MQAYTYVEKGKFALLEKPKPVLLHERDAIVKVTLASICSSDLHIKHGSVPRAVPGITVGHEMVGVVESVGSAVTHVKPGDRVTGATINKTGFFKFRADKVGEDTALAQIIRLVEEASQNTHRATRTEIKILSAVDVPALQRQADDASRELRLLDNTLQATNWTADLME